MGFVNQVSQENQVKKQTFFLSSWFGAEKAGAIPSFH